MRRTHLVALILAAPALAQKAKTPTTKQLAADVEKLKTDVEAAGKAAAGAEASRAALADVEARLVKLQGEVDRVAASAAAEADWRRELERLDAELSQLRGRVAELWDRAWREEEEEKAFAGPVLRTADGRFEMKLGGGLHFRHEFLREAPSGGESRTATSTFRLARAKLITDGHVWSPNLGLYVQLDFTRAMPLEDYFVEYRRWKYAKVRFGQYKVPFDRQRVLNDFKMQFADRSLASEAFDLDRDVGLMISGGWRGDLVAWQAAMLNGGGENRLNDNVDYMYVARLLVSPLGPVPMDEGDVDGGPLRVTIGGAFVYNLLPTDLVAREGLDPTAGGDDADGDGEIDNVAVMTAGAELAARWKGASVQGEYFWRKEDPGAEEIGPDRTFKGFYGQVGYFVIPSRFEVAARVSVAKPHYYGTALEDRQALPDEVQEHAGVLTYARFGHSLKLQLEYAHIIEKNVGAAADDGTPTFDRTDHRVRTQLQAAF